jgi:hypothetical protein
MDGREARKKQRLALKRWDKDELGRVLINGYWPSAPDEPDTRDGRNDVDVAWPGGLSPPSSPRTVREPLDSYGSRLRLGLPSGSYATVHKFLQTLSSYRKEF